MYVRELDPHVGVPDAELGVDFKPSTSDRTTRAC